MKRLLTSSATALILATSAYAGDYTNTFSDMRFDQSVNLNASGLIGMRVYATEADISNDHMVSADGEKEWNDIGEINEIVLTRSGDVQSVIVGVGGFLGLNEKDVAIDMSQLQFVSDGENADDFFLVIKASVAGIQEAPAYTNTIERLNEQASTDRTGRTAPNVKREGYQKVAFDDLTTEELTGASVYGTGDEDVGEISELLLTDAGTLDRAVIDVGGFLGLGERPVAVDFDALTIIRADNGDGVRVYIDTTQEMLEQKPAYQG